MFLATQVDELDFWNDPRINFRKSNQERHKVNNLKDSRSNLRKKNRQIKKVVIEDGLNEQPTKKMQIRENRTGHNNSMSQSSAALNAHGQWITRNFSWPKVAPRFRAKKVSTRMTKMMLQEAVVTSTRYTPLDDDNFSEQLSPYAIKKQLYRISSKFPNTNITIDVIGRTVEYNDIVMMKITQLSDLQRHFRAEDDKYADEAPQKKIIFIVHGLSVMGISQLPCLSMDRAFMKLLSYYIAHLDNFDIFLIPLANPDGFGISRYESLWNKNMSPQSACPGVNVDRNFDVAWNSSNVVSSCSQQYPGNSPFSEAESRAIRDVFHKYSHKIVAYINVHAGSYQPSVYKGEAVLYPKGFSEIQSDDDKYIDLRGEIDEALRNASFRRLSVTVDTLHNWYGKVFGSSVDYAATIYGIPYSLELVMQIYYNNYMDTDETYGDSALNEVWSRVVDVIFKNIWRNMNNNDI